VKRTPDIVPDDGLTLIELMIAVTVLSIIMLPLISSFLLGLLESTSSRERISDSASAQLISTYLLGDVQSAEEVYSEAQLSAGADCATTGTPKLELKWTDPKTNEAIIVDYYSAPNGSGSHRELRRVSCVDGVAEDPLLLALNLDTDIFDATCAPTTDCVSPESVSVHIKAESTSPQEKSSYSPLDFTFAASRRRS
jgi:prepilin-type N-terminal cleavage/methylation domain-containing protein